MTSKLPWSFCYLLKKQSLILTRLPSLHTGSQELQTPTEQQFFIGLSNEQFPQAIVGKAPNAKGGQDHDIHFRMAEEPENMLKQDWVAAASSVKEASAKQ